MQRDDGLVIAEIAIHQPLHDLVALRIEFAVGAGLRYAVGQLAAAQVVIGRDGDLSGARDRGLRQRLPIDVKLPEVNPVVLEHFLELGFRRRP